MAIGDPALIENSLVESLPLPVQRCVERVLDHSDDPYRIYSVVSYRLSGTIEPDDLRAAKTITEWSLMPASREAIIRELARMRSLTVSRSVGSDDLALVLTAFADELADFPADAVIAVLRSWPRENKFWPALSEMIEAIKPLWEKRRWMEHALMNYRLSD